MFVSKARGKLIPLIATSLLAFSPFANAQSTEKPTCLYVASYHAGYAWSDGVERGLRDTLGDQCSITEFYMDTKRLKSSDNKIDAGKSAYQLIERTQPDVVITSDDNAAKYLIVPYLVDKEIPVVFSGINWTVQEYGFPATNVTGIVEVAPIKPMLVEGVKTAKLDSSKSIRVAYVGANTLSEIKNSSRILATAKSLGMSFDILLSDNFTHWKIGFELAQKYDLVVMGSSSGIADFDENQAKAWANAKSKTLSLTNHDWMMPYTALGFTKVPEEHGEWAAASAIAILSGVKAIDIPLVTNRRWDTWSNEALLKGAEIDLEQATILGAKKVK